MTRSEPEGTPGPIDRDDGLGIDHVVVLMLENRSFDHLLGYLDHPSPRFEGLLRDGPHANPGWPGTPDVETSPDAKPVLPVGPDHSHEAAMEQLGLQPKAKELVPTNSGFVQSYERRARGLAPAHFGGFVGWVVDRWRDRHAPADVIGRGPLVMRCQAPESVPVLTTLAKEFAVCTHWFSSVPGETWPNRNFLHAGTSDGWTEIQPGLYDNRTIFQVVEDAGRTWRIYHSDTPQVWVFPALWNRPDRLANWFDFEHFDEHVAQGHLADYTFIEPNHRPPVHEADFLAPFGRRDVSDSQHPENNLVRNEDYDKWTSTGPTDFNRAESLIADVYESLRSNPKLFERTMLVVTYDEHGGFYDHISPPTGVPSPRRSWLSHVRAGLLKLVYYRKTAPFDFTMLGVRVPAVVVSPRIGRLLVDDVIHDHTTVITTLRELFAPKSKPLTPRDAWAPSLLSLVGRAAPRRGDELPDLSRYRTSPPAGGGAPDPATPYLGQDHYDEYVDLARKVGQKLGPAARPPARPLRRDPATARHVTDAFRAQAEQAANVLTGSAAGGAGRAAVAVARTEP